ncbi:Rv3654c family TadE-like protein [Nesterenkonia sp. CF4.4]|uniref:Rv3654c family TadE-like protein n=1 Tax=Nesterenkonia sp. CF4.4 TaxID=3373079 RepID=UPI003EE49B33
MRPRESIRGDRGSGTVLALGLIMALLVLLAATQVLSMVAVSSAQAARGADLAALAGADAVRGISTGSPCAVAEAVASRNDVKLISCTVIGEDSTEVLVHTAAPILPDRLIHAGGLDLSGLLSRGSARAGPPTSG